MHACYYLQNHEILQRLYIINFRLQVPGVEVRSTIVESGLCRVPCLVNKFSIEGRASGVINLTIIYKEVVVFFFLFFFFFLIWKFFNGLKIYVFLFFFFFVFAKKLSLDLKKILFIAICHSFIFKRDSKNVKKPLHLKDYIFLLYVPRNIDIKSAEYEKYDTDVVVTLPKNSEGLITSKFR